MDWAFLLPTIAGAAVALTGALLLDGRWHRGERARQRRAERRHSYLAFLDAVDAAYGHLRVLADPVEQIPGSGTVLRVIGDEGVYKVRESLLVTGSPAVVRIGENVLTSLDLLAQAIDAGANRDSRAYHDAYHAFSTRVWQLRRTVREDLGVADLAITDLDKPGWETSDLCRT